MKRKIMTLLLCLALVTGSASSYVMAKVDVIEPMVMPLMTEEAIRTEPASMTTSNEPTDKALESAIKAVKNKITIPKEYSEFTYYYYGSNSYSGVYWNLNWRKPQEYSYIDVSLDKDFNFISYNTYSQKNRNKKLASYLKSELVDKAKGFIKKIASDIYPKIDFVSANYDGIYSNTYSYHFQRKEKNIIFPDNHVTVRVDAATGEVTSASIEWIRDAKIPSGEAKLSKEDASKIIGENLKMKLSYKTNYYRIYDYGQNDIVKKAFLVYEPDLSYISIDANTGEIYLNRSEWVETDFTSNKVESDAKADEAASGGTAQLLTDEEISKIRELEKLISKDKAIEIVTSNPYLHIDKNLMTYTASLNQTYNSKDKDASYVWNITLRDSRPIDYSKDQDQYRAYANAIVDAKTGKILSFNSSIKSNYDRSSGKWLPIEIKYDRSYGQKVLEKFLNSQVKDIFNKTRLTQERDDYVAYYKDENIPVYGGYSYQYNRFNEGIEYEYNGIYGSVDGVTGKIYYYNTNWDYDIVFESPKNVMTPEEAFNHYISKEGYNLLYEINVINEYDPNYKSDKPYYDFSEAYRVAYEIRLVYRPDIYPTYISPFTGEQLDYKGDSYTSPEPYLYNDIADTKENREILLLSDMNIGFEGASFMPEKAITEGEISQLLEKLGYWNMDSEDINSSSKLITREELAYSFIKRLGFEKIANISGIYTSGYEDEDTINPKYIGAVALAKGLKLFPDNKSKLFNPKSNISRREAVLILFNFVEAETDSY